MTQKRKLGRPAGGPFTLRAVPEAVMAAQRRMAEAVLAHEIEMAKREADVAPLFRPGATEIDAFLGVRRFDV